MEPTSSPSLSPRADALGVPGCKTAWRWLTLPALLLAVLWAYQRTILSLISDWRTDPNYSVGLLVPLAALYLVWQDRTRLARIPIQACWWGLLLLFAAQGLRAYGVIRIYESAERYSMLLTISGLVLLVGGRHLFRSTLWLQLFLLLMIPLPGRLHNAIASPLQGLATSGAVYALEALGVSVIREGNLVVLNDRVPLAVAEACSGLRMLTAFIFVSAMLAFLVRRPPWQKAVLLLSSIPIAIACNLLRLVATAVLFLTTTSEVADRFFHDFAGITMMPLAVLMLVGELWLLAHLVIEENDGCHTHQATV